MLHLSSICLLYSEIYIKQYSKINENLVSSVLIEIIFWVFDCIYIIHWFARQGYTAFLIAFWPKVYTLLGAPGQKDKHCPALLKPAENTVVPDAPWWGKQQTQSVSNSASCSLLVSVDTVSLINPHTTHFVVLVRMPNGASGKADIIMSHEMLKFM